MRDPLALTTTDTFKRGLRVGETYQKDFVLRSATAGDYFAAEADCTSSRPITFRAALAAQQLVRIGTFEGPFTLDMLGKLTPGDLEILQTALTKLEKEGEDAQPG